MARGASSLTERPSGRHLCKFGPVALRVLIVDDIPEMRVTIRSRLRFSHQAEIVGEASTGAEAIMMSRELRPDAVVLDLMLPDIRERNLCEMVRHASPESRVIVFTAYESDKAWYRERGVQVLPKEDMDGMVRAVLGQEPSEATS